jgi:hypothetical protein
LRRIARFAVRAAVTLLVIIGFLCGLAEYPNMDTAPMLGVSFGLGSAIYWGLTAAADDDRSFPWNGLFNACAAICAAVAVGYLTPREACTQAPEFWLPRFICHIYPSPPRSAPLKIQIPPISNQRPPL